MSLEELALSSLIRQAAIKIHPHLLSPNTILLLYPHLSNICGIHDQIETILCNSSTIIRDLKILFHFVFGTPSLSSQEDAYISTKYNSFAGRNTIFRGDIKKDAERCELLISKEHGVGSFEELWNFYENARSHFSIEGRPIGVKCVFTFQRQWEAPIALTEKLFFKPLRNNLSLLDIAIRQYMRRNLESLKKILANNATGRLSYYHIFTISSLNPQILNWQSCPCQSYICTGGLDKKYSEIQSVCSLSYCDTHPSFSDWK